MTASSERDLRRAVARLSRCAIADIEAIWGELEPRQRSRLRPWLEQASGLVLEPADLDAPAPTQDHTDDIAVLARYVGTLPTPIAARVLACLEATQFAHVLAALPREHRDALQDRPAAVELQPAARRALQAAVWTAMHDTTTHAAPPSPRAPTPRRRVWSWLRWKAR
jgi:hypothetical protein